MKAICIVLIVVGLVGALYGLGKFSKAQERETAASASIGQDGEITGELVSSGSVNLSSSTALTVLGLSSTCALIGAVGLTTVTKKRKGKKR